MDLSIILWIGGMLFTLSIFAVKVGFGLGFGGMRWKGISLILVSYLLLFVLITLLSEHLIRVMEPVLRKGPYLHALMAVGMIAWGIYLIKRSTVRGQKSLVTHHSLLLLIPCPVCLTAITFSTWAALSVIKLPASLVGVGLGITFIALSLSFFSLTRLKKAKSPEINLGLSMMGIGLYFLASLFLPAKIEEAKGVYRSFIAEGNGIDISDSIGVFVLLFAAILIGFFANKKQFVKK